MNTPPEKNTTAGEREISPKEMADARAEAEENGWAFWDGDAYGFGKSPLPPKGSADRFLREKGLTPPGRKLRQRIRKRAEKIAASGPPTPAPAAAARAQKQGPAGSWDVAAFGNPPAGDTQW